MLRKGQPGYEKVYALWDDEAGIKRLQTASLEGENIGLARDHGLVASEEWWQAVNSGELTLHTVKGIVCDLALESMNDWPTFKILCEDGTVTDSVTRKALPLKGDPYLIGREIIWQYVIARLKKRDKSVGECSKLTVAVWLAETVTLFRPVGEAELRLIAGSNFSAFPLRLPEQPIFYPVCNYRYAEEIASKWNAKEGPAYVTRFQVAKRHLDQYETHQVGGKEHVEYWIPAERLEEFNRNIVGRIGVVKSFSAIGAKSQR